MYIAISGNIGAGKTTLVGKLARHYNFTPEYEAVERNPYLKDFYQDMNRWAFPLQISFLSLRFSQGLAIKSASTGVVLDRTIYEDAEIFAKNLYQSKYLSERDYKNYLFLYQTMLELVPAPKLLIYLRGRTGFLMERIRQRISEKKMNRFHEELIPIDYLDHLNQCYENWINSFNICHKIIVDIEQKDLRQPETFDQLTEKIDPYLK